MARGSDRLDAADHRRRRAAGVDERVDLRIERGNVIGSRVEDVGGAEPPRASPGAKATDPRRRCGPHRRRARPARTSRRSALRRQSGTRGPGRDVRPCAWWRPPPTAAPAAQRPHPTGVRHGMRHVGVDRDVPAQGAVDRWRGKELHVRAQVVAAGRALPTARHGVAARRRRAGRRDLGSTPRADPRDPARQFVAEDHRRGRRRSRRSGRAGSSAHPSRTLRRRRPRRAPHVARRRTGPVLDDQGADAGHHTGPHGFRRHDPIMPLPWHLATEPALHHAGVQS